MKIVNRVLNVTKIIFGTLLAHFVDLISIFERKGVLLAARVNNDILEKRLRFVCLFTRW